MSKEAMNLALEALKTIVERFDYEQFTSVCELDDAKDAITTLEESLANQEEPLPPVEIVVDVISDGASVVAFYRRPNAVMEMFYSQFHPLAKQEQGEPVAQHRDLHGHMMVVAHRAADKATNNGQKFASQKEIVRAICTAIQVDKNLFAKLSTPQQRKPLTDEKIQDGYNNCEWTHAPSAHWFEAGVRFSEAAHGIKE
jgi:hypothetical protein